MTAALSDRRGRPLASLRLSVTDRCNLRCTYCMPEEDYRWLPRAEILSYEEMATLAGVFTAEGVERLRLTGGEPLLRRDLESLIGLLSANQAIRDLSLTTNGVLLPGRCDALREAGLDRLTVSIDTLRPERFRELTRRDDLAHILEGVRQAGQAGFRSVKLNAVVMRGFNDDELADLLAFGRESGAEVRFIEYMDVGGATRWSADRVVSRTEILSRLEADLGPVAPAESDSSAPADRFRLADGLTFGIIASTTAPFCGSCDRSRITADGHWFLCLYARDGIDLRGPLRAGATREELTALVRAGWGERDDRGAEERLELEHRVPLRRPRELRDDPLMEMHTRGG